MLQQKIDCTIFGLDKAIKLHDIHMKDPATTTEPSQEELMKYIIDAYECLDKSKSTKSIRR